MICKFDNIGGYIDPDIANAEALIVAGAGLDGLEVQGESIDMQNFNSLVISVACVATLAVDETLKITINEQTSTDDSTWATATAALAITTVLTGESGGSTEIGITNTSINTEGKARYVRYNVTPTLSAGSTDTAAFTATAIKGGSRTLPT